MEKKAAMETVYRKRFDRHFEELQRQKSGAGGYQQMSLF